MKKALQKISVRTDAGRDTTSSSRKASAFPKPALLFPFMPFEMHSAIQPNTINYPRP